MADKYRVQFDFTAEAFAELQSLKDRLGAASRAEAVRMALGVLRWVLEQQSSGRKILVEKTDGEQQEVVFPFAQAAERYPAAAAAPASAAQAEMKG